MRGALHEVSITAEDVSVVINYRLSVSVENGGKMRFDSTFVQANIHHPTDSSLLNDLVRVICRTLKKSGLPSSFRFRDRDAVMTEGVMKMAYPGRKLAAMGIEVDDLDAYYLFQTRMGVVWPVDPESGMLTGEESYTGTDGFEGIADRKLGPDDIVSL